MPSTTRFRTAPFCTLILAAATVAGSGCRPSEEGPAEHVSPQQGGLSSTAGGAEARAEAALPAPDEGREAVPPPAQSDLAALDEPSPQPQQPEPAPLIEPEPLEMEPVGEPAGPIEPPGNGSGLRANPLRNGSMPSPTQTSVGPVGTPVEEHRPGGGEDGEPPFDPIKENGPIFDGWTDPKFALVISGRQDGYLEPCGCAGLDRMKGGLSRRISMLDQFRNERGWAVAAVDVGGLVNDYGPQAELKFQTSVNAIQAMKYDAVALGKSDLQFSVGELLFAGTGEESPFISANAAPLGFDAGLIQPMRIIERGGMKLGITSAIGRKWQKEINNDDVELADPQQKLAELVPALDKECDLLILLAHATREESIELAREFPQFDVVVTAGGTPEPPDEPERVDGDGATLIEVGEKGMHAVVLGFFDGPPRPPRYQRVPLDSRFPQSDQGKKLMTQYQEALEEEGLEGLGVRPLPLPGKSLLGGFVGSEKCKSCHEESYKVWRKSGHARAWQTLVELDPPRNFDPECISCHVVGWSPQNYRPFETGFLSEQHTPHLIDTGCETCHGPGEAHVKAEQGADFELQEKLQKAAVITLEESQQAVSKALSDKQHCMNCHDLDNSPDFHFQTYWPKIEHREE